ncbi:MAG: protein phosphatase 2C domain-containing protein, partial [Muribaculaceae bacterium]|nr:protein phosphatase 2C domain-containing protein [Muribaculaceae bacterium]
MITIRQPLSFTEIGQKDNQEDYLFPSRADEETRVFIMCDGMGGHDNGEVASMTAANVLGNYLSSCSTIDIPVFETGLAKAYDALDNIDTNSLKKPGTTMTCLCLNEDNYLVAHIGDSRIYHIRPSLYNFNTKRGGILYQSSDHSLVNDLLKAGELTEDEAKDFPQKNIITRAMQPHLAKRYKADVYTFDDIQGGDYFFMCSDGVLERLSNEALCEILAQDNLSDELKLAKIKSICENKTKDNYTCWLIPIDKTNVKETNSKNTQIIQAIEEGESTGLSVAEDPVPMITQQSKEKKNKYSFLKFSVDAENFNTEKLLLYIDL